MRPMPSVLDVVTRRLALPRSQRGLIEIERVLAAVRVVLALSSLVFLQVNPTGVFPYNGGVHGLLVLYFAHSVGLLVLLQWRAEISSGFSVLVHAADILWPAVISLFAGGLNSPFFLYFIFALLAA